MPTSKFRNLLNNRTREFSLFVFTVDVFVLATVLIVLWVMPEPPTPGENCGYMCLQCTSDTTKLCCGCRDEILQTYVEQVCHLFFIQKLGQSIFRKPIILEIKIELCHL